MGNMGNGLHPLPQIWQRINPSYLRHRLTQEIIQEHLLLLPSHDELQATTSALKKRIALHHPAIAKVIYFRQADRSSLCSHLSFTQELVVYSEYTGDTLERVAEEKGERAYHSPCQCTHILSAADYLREHYGFFLLTPRMVFLGNRRERATKVWINSKVELCQRQLPSSQQEMCDSICRLLRYLKASRICTALTDDQIEIAHAITSLSHLKNFVFDAHRNREEVNRHRKSNSVHLSQENRDDFRINSQERIDKSEAGRKVHNVKANSMPQKEGPRGWDSLPLKGKDANDQNRFIAKANHIKNASPDVFHRPVSAHPHPLKVNFIYPQQESTRIQSKTVPIVLPARQTSLQPLIDPLESMQDEIKQLENKIPFIAKPRANLLTNMEPLAFSQEDVASGAHSPEGLRSQPQGSHFTAREMELPLQQVEEKVTPARLPTTSRSPKVSKEVDAKLPQEGPEVIHNRYQRNISTQSSKYWKNKEKSSISNSNKFQKYKDAIKNYEQKLRQKLAATMTTTSNPIAKPKNHLAIRKTTSSPKPSGECKETKSFYNNSDEENIEHSKHLRPQAPNPPIPFDSQQSIPSQTDIATKKEVTTKKMRERLQKMDLQRELQKQKKMIQNEMQDLLKQNAMRDQYRSIREKIKQKKETFAQLKAEATKILQDLDY